MNVIITLDMNTHSFTVTMSGVVCNLLKPFRKELLSYCAFISMLCCARWWCSCEVTVQDDIYAL